VENMYIFYLSLFNSSEKEKLLLGRKNTGTEYDPPPLLVYPESYACEYCRCLRRDPNRSHIV
jgi:hypothetical protein